MLGEKIRVLREIKGFSQEYMAETLGVSISAYGKLERNQTELNLTKLQNIAKILGISTVHLLSFDENDIFNEYDPKPYKSVLDDNERALYERMLKEKDEIIEFLKKIIDKKFSDK